MAGYRKFSDAWRQENAPETLAGLATLAGVGVRFAPGGQAAKTDAKVVKVEHEAGAKRGYPPAKVAKVAKAETLEAGVGCKVTIVEILATGLRFRRTYAHLQLKPPDYIPEDRWQQCIEDGRAFLHQWGEAAQRLGWTSADLFGLHTPPAKPHPSYSRLSRYDATGLIWLLQGREVLALTEATATIKNPISGSITTYRRYNKPALGPLGDSLLDIDLGKRP
jgi:hypothetical protein